MLVKAIEIFNKNGCAVIFLSTASTGNNWGVWLRQRRISHRNVIGVTNWSPREYNGRARGKVILRHSGKKTSQYHAIPEPCVTLFCVEAIDRVCFTHGRYIDWLSSIELNWGCGELAMRRWKLANDRCIARAIVFHRKPSVTPHTTHYTTPVPTVSLFFRSGMHNKSTELQAHRGVYTVVFSSSGIIFLKLRCILFFVYQWKRECNRTWVIAE